MVVRLIHMSVLAFTACPPYVSGLSADFPRRQSVTGTQPPPTGGNRQRQSATVGAAAVPRRRRARPCSAPPRSRPGAYPPRSGAGPGRAPRRAQCQPSEARQVRVEVPGEPPELVPEAALALFRLLVNARAGQEGDRQMTGHESDQETGSDG
jgi:hypothetical protein